jgi:hypothetical protein
MFDVAQTLLGTLTDKSLFRYDNCKFDILSKLSIKNLLTFVPRV